MAAGIVEMVSDKVSFATKVPMLMKATSDNDTPTPGYLYQEINKITTESFSNCRLLLDFLNERLKKSSPHIKYKSLKIMTYLSANGQSEFRSALRHKNQQIRDSASFSGLLDSLQGDSLNQKVRTASKELIELLFNIENPESSQQYFIMAGPSGQKMEGFGNMPTNTSSKSGRFLDKVKELSSHIPSFGGYVKTDNQEDFWATNSSIDGQYVSFGEVTSSTSRSCVPSEVEFVNYSGNTWSQPKGVLTKDSNMLDEDKYNDDQVDDDGDDGDDGDDDDDDDINNGATVENKLVNKITEEGGIRAIPSKESLGQFTQRCRTLDMVKILKLIDGRMEDQSLDVQMKCLFALEHLLKSTIPNIAAKVLEYVNLEQLIDSESSKIKTKANKVLHIAKSRKGASVTTEEFRIEEEQASSLPSNEQLLTEDQKVFSSVDLLGPASPVGHNNDDIFQGLQIHERPPETQVNYSDQSIDIDLSDLQVTSREESSQSSAIYHLDELNVLEVPTDKTALKCCKSVETFDPLDMEFTYSEHGGIGKESKIVDDILEIDNVNLVSETPSLLQPTTNLNHQSTNCAPRSTTNLQPKSCGLESLSSLQNNRNDLNMENNFTGQSGLTGQSYLTSQSGLNDLTGQSGLNCQSYLTGQSGVTGLTYQCGLTGLTGQSELTGQSGLTGLKGLTYQYGLTGQSGVTGQSGKNCQSGLSSLTGQSTVTCLTGFHGNAVASSNTRFIPRIVSNSTLPLDLSKPNIQETDFDFLSKPKRESAFSFVQDEMKASKK